MFRAGVRPAAEILYFCFAKRKYPKKRRPGIRALRVPCASRKSRRLRNSRPTAAQTVLADYPATSCDARRSSREPIRGSESGIGLRIIIFVGLQAALVLVCRQGCEAIPGRLAGQGVVVGWVERSDTQRAVVAGPAGLGFVRYCACFGREFVPRPRYFAFASPKESIQRKGDPTFAPYGCPVLPPQGRKPVLSAKALRTWLFV